MTLLAQESGLAGVKAKTKGARLTGRKRQAQVTLPQGDFGPDTRYGSAQMERASIRPDLAKGGDWHKKVRLHRLDIMARSHRRGRAAQITPRQRTAGMELYDRWERTQASPEPAWYRPFVDGGYSGGQVGDARLEAEAQYKQLLRVIPRDCLAIAMHVVIRQRSIRPEWTTDRERADAWLDRLHVALNAMARALRI